MKKVPFFMHDLGAPELENIAQVFKGPILTTGETVGEFERLFARYLGRKHVLAVNSCTAALHLSLVALNLEPGDEVITTPLTFVATTEAIIHAGGRPVFVDVEADTGNIDISAIEAAIGPKTRAIVPVHLFGLMCEMRSLSELATHRGLAVVEDAAHCIEGRRDGLGVGEASLTACFSFFATKNITCGEGGAIATDDARLFDRLKPMRNHGMNKTSADRFREGYSHWDVRQAGFKCNMGNIEAAILLAQMPRLEINLKKRTRLAELYKTYLSRVRGVELPASRPGAKHSRHLFPIWVRAEIRDKLINLLNDRGISTVVNYRPVHYLSWYQRATGYKIGDFPQAERIGNSTLSLPLYPNMPDSDVEYVTAVLAEILDSI